MTKGILLPQHGVFVHRTRRRPFPIEAAGFCPVPLRLVCHGVPLFLFPCAFYALSMRYTDSMLEGIRILCRGGIGYPC